MIISNPGTGVFTDRGNGDRLRRKEQSYCYQLIVFTVSLMDSLAATERRELNKEQKIDKGLMPYNLDDGKVQRSYTDHVRHQPSEGQKAEGFIKYSKGIPRWVQLTKLLKVKLCK